MAKNKEPGKQDIPIEERCEDFDKLWRKIYYQVMKYWDHIEEEEIVDIKQLDDYITD